MDGGFAPKDLPEGMDHPGKLGALADALRNTGWSEAEVEGFTYGNWRRFLETAIP
jgi:microsomal dipeptidase-like Zn-dependent dipeptidase